MLLYLKMARSNGRLRIKDFEDPEWGSKRRCLDIRNVIDRACEQILGHSGIEYLDEDGRPAKSPHNRVYIRLTAPEMGPPSLAISPYSL